MSGLLLFTVAEAAEQLHKSRRGVRRLIHRGRVSAYRLGHRYLIPDEDIRRYAAALPHPPHIMAMVYAAWTVLGSLKRPGWKRAVSVAGTPQLRAMHEHLLAPSVPLWEGILEAVKAGQYERAEGLRDEIGRLLTDYRMLYEPFEEGRQDMPRLFGKGGEA